MGLAAHTSWPCAVADSPCKLTQTCASFVTPDEAKGTVNTATAKHIHSVHRIHSVHTSGRREKRNSCKTQRVQPHWHSLALSPFSLVHWLCSAFTGRAFSGFAALSPAERAFWNGANDAEVEFPTKLRPLVNGRWKNIAVHVRMCMHTNAD